MRDRKLTIRLLMILVSNLKMTRFEVSIKVEETVLSLKEDEESYNGPATKRAEGEKWIQENLSIYDLDRSF